jgi:hypothetical protein
VATIKETGGKLEFAWPSDPLLQYALSLSALLFGGIAFLVLTISIKHGRRLRSSKIQHQLVALLTESIQRSLDSQKIDSQINAINHLIHFHKKDVAYGWVRLLEQTPILEREKYIAIAVKTNMKECIPHCLYQEGLAERCVALEAIGLSNFTSFASSIEKFSESPGVAPYACVALARLIHEKAIIIIINSYEQGFLSTTQALSALAEIPRDKVIDYLDNQENPRIPSHIYDYLEL